MGFDYLSPDSFQPQDDSVALDPVEMYKKKVLGARWKQPARPGGSALGRPPAGGGQMSGANAAEQRAFYNQLDNSALKQPPQQPVVQQPDAARYFTPSPDEYIGTNQPTPAEASPNRGGFNQADGLARPDYSRGDELRKQANDLQHPSWWKKLVNGDEGLAYQAEHKYRLAQYEDLAANNKFRFDHPEAFKDQTPKLQPVRAGEGLWDANKNAWAVEPQDKVEKNPDVERFVSGGKQWGRKKNSTDAEPIRASVPDMPGPNPDGSAGYTGKGAQLDAPEKEFRPSGSKSENFAGPDGTMYEKVFDPDTQKTVVRPLPLPVGAVPPGKAGKGGAARPDWGPKDLEKIATKNASDRRRAEATQDPTEIQRTEDRIKARLNSGGLEEDDTTGEVRVAAKGAEKPTVGDVKPGDTIRNVGSRKTPLPEGTVIEKGGKQYKKIRGKWEPFTGTGKR